MNRTLYYEGAEIEVALLESNYPTVNYKLELMRGHWPDPADLLILLGGQNGTVENYGDICYVEVEYD